LVFFLDSRLCRVTIYSNPHCASSLSGSGARLRDPLNPMKQVGAKVLVRHGMGLVMGLVLAGALSPSTACAACGDHVLYGAEHGGTLAGLDSVKAPQVPRPCSRPSCSRPDSTPLAPSVPPPGEQEDWASLADPLRDAATGPVSWIRCDETSSPVSAATC